MLAIVEIHPVTPDRLDDVANLFETNSATRGCWCMWFIGTHREVTAGWHDGGNRRAFEEMVHTADPPLGMLAYDEGQAVGWIAMGPRSRYPRIVGPHARLVKSRDETEDDVVWMLPCFFVRVGHRGKGTTGALVEAAVDQACDHHAKAVEGIPIADDYPKSQDGWFVGKERRFAECGFACVARPSPRRVVMRRDLP